MSYFQKKESETKKYIAERLAVITPVLQKAAMGDFSGKIKIPEKEDEFTELLVAVNLMMDDLRELEEVRQKNEEALRESEEKYKSIVDNMRDVIFRLSPLGVIEYVSPNVKELFGYAPEELIGHHLKKTTPMVEVPKALSALNNLLSGKLVEHFELGQKNAKGEVVPTEINAISVKKDGKIIGVQGNMRDITERKKVEGELKKNVEKMKKMNKLMVGRELRMEELKKEIDELKGKKEETS